MAMIVQDGRFEMEKRDGLYHLYFCYIRVQKRSNKSLIQPVKMDCYDANGSIDYETVSYIEKAGISMEEFSAKVIEFFAWKEEDSIVKDSHYYRKKIVEQNSLEDICLLLVECMNAPFSHTEKEDIMKVAQKQMKSSFYDPDKVITLFKETSTRALVAFGFLILELWDRYDQGVVNPSTIDSMVDIFFEKMKRSTTFPLNYEEASSLVTCTQVFAEAPLKKREGYVQLMKSFLKENADVSVGERKRLFVYFQKQKEAIFPRITLEEYSEYEYLMSKGNAKKRELERQKRTYFETVEMNTDAFFDEKKYLFLKKKWGLDADNIFILCLINYYEKKHSRKNMDDTIYFLLGSIDEMDPYCIRRLGEAFSKKQIRCSLEVQKAFYQKYREKVKEQKYQKYIM